MIRLDSFNNFPYSFLKSVGTNMERQLTSFARGSRHSMHQESDMMPIKIALIHLQDSQIIGHVACQVRRDGVESTFIDLGFYQYDIFM